MTHETLLAILQQAEYEPERFLDWVSKHRNSSEHVKPEKWTPKLKLISVLSQLFFWLPLELKILSALRLLSPIDLLIRETYCGLAQILLWWRKQRGLQVVAIAGSYAKTSTKQILEHLLSEQLAVLITPKSINTPLGIAQVIFSSLKAKHQLFVVELGEYYQGDIESLARFVMPDYGIVTPIGRQHLERMGTQETVAETIHELRLYFESSPKDCLVAEQNNTFWDPEGAENYGTSDRSEWFVHNPEVSLRGTEFEVVGADGFEQHVFTPLLGTHQAVNILPSVWLATRLKLSIEKVVARCATVPYVYRRHEPTFAENNVLILDNSYNTNPDSVQASFALLKALPADRRIMITLGFVELGEKSTEIHREFGQQLAKEIDYLGLIESPQAQCIIDGFVKAGGKRDRVYLGKNQEDTLAQLRDKIIPNTIVLFEGGYREILT